MPKSPTPASVPLTYTIASSTPHSGKYGPEHIMEDKLQDQSSRWSGAFQGNANQWIILRLQSVAVLKTITFGKFSKPHPCNMKEFKVFVGTSEEHMTEVLHAGLKNDTIPETFVLNHVNSAGVSFPTHFVKIVPVLAHGQNFHISIWHVSMTGIVEPTYVERVRLAYDEYRETEVLRYVLKHLRQRRLLSPYQSILTRADILLEHPLVTQLHESLVLHGNWSRTEQLLDRMSSSGLFDSYLRSCQPHSVWSRIHATDADGDTPPARGGHAMCMDPVNEMIYIFGGWSGEKSLADFWVYSVKEEKWKVLSHSTTQEQNAPGARSCHKMVFDTKTGSIYVLGRLNDADGLRAPTPANIRAHGTTVQSSNNQPLPPQLHSNSSEPPGSSEPKMLSAEFYRYHTRGVLAGKWDFLSIDTAASGGPPLIFDHQMAMDSEAQILYVFGGRVVDGDWDVSKYSGLYSYNVSTSKWKLLQLPQSDASHGSPFIPSRFGHSMVLDPTTKILYIFAGQREDKYLSDMYAYDTKTGIATEIFSNFSTAGGPEACFTQRAVIDPSLKEIYVFCGLTRSSIGASRTLRGYLSNWVYRYDTRPGKWVQILCQPERLSSEMPMPRFAHQVVYNPKTKSVFLHGGNAGGPLGMDGKNVLSREADGDVLTIDGPGGTDEGKDASSMGGKEKRLDDFWRMELRRPGPEEIIRRAKFLIRRQQFREMCEELPPVKALNFLQKEVASVVDHKNPQEEEIFRSLLTHLLSPSSKVAEKTSLSSPSSDSMASSLEREDSRESSPRPRKRSRAELEGSEGGRWTSELEVSSTDDDAATPAFLGCGGIQHLRDVTDPYEAMIRGEHAAAETPLTGARYGQRTEVFENLLKFVAEGEKQPSESLLDLVERDRLRCDVVEQTMVS